MARSKQYQKLLNSKRWKTLRIQYLQAHPLCERCWREGIEKTGYPYIVSAVDVHHVIPVESAHSIQEMEALCFNESAGQRLEALCIPCHIKTHQEARSHTKEAHQQREKDRLQQWIDRRIGRNGKF